MKLTVGILLVFNLSLSARTISQTITFSGKNVPIQQVFSVIESQTGYSVLAKDETVKKVGNVSADVKSIELSEFLALILRDKPFNFEIESKTIFIKQKSKSLKSSSRLSPAVGSAPPVRGIVRGPNGQPLAGATIKVKGKNINTVSNEQGYFEIIAETGSFLVVSYIGFQERELRVSNERQIDIQLVHLNISLDTAEVVINTGYQTVNPERFVGAATIVDSVILERQIGRNLLARLDGTANGLLFDKTGRSGINSFQLRGISTLNSANDLNGLPSQNPLIILDDFPFTGDINTINPNDVESISILKDAVATSIWGARAGNGVIVIKTRRPKKNTGVSVNLTSNITFVEKPDLNYFPQMTSSDYIDVEHFLFNNGYYDLFFQFPQFFRTTPVADILDKKRSGELSEDETAAQINVLRMSDVRNDINKYVYRNAVNKQNYLSLYQGTGLFSYKLALGADNNLSGVKGPGRNDRYTINSGINFKPVDPLTVSVGVDYIYEKFKGDAAVVYPLSTGSGLLYPYANLADENGNHLAIPYALNVAYLETLPKDKLLDWQYRPLDELEAINSTDIKSLLRMNFSAALKITSWLTAEAKYQYTSQKTDSRNLQDINVYYARNEINRFTNPSTFVRAIPLGGILDLSSGALATHNLRGQLNFNKNFNTLHAFTGILATEMGKTVLTANSHRLYGYDDNSNAYANLIDFKDSYMQYFGGSARIPNKLSISERRNNLVSVLGNASYTYDRRYGIYFSARRDGTNIFGVNTNNKFKPLWSAGARWNLSNEEFYDLKWMPDIALRVTYGYSGNVNNTISALSTITYQNYLSSFGENQAVINRPPNPDLRWEEVRTLNLGVDFSLFNGRISGGFEWWKKKSKDVIANFPLDPTLGITGGYMNKNAADLNGRGFDLILSTNNITGKFGWRTNLNVNYAKTIVSRYFQNFTTTPNGPSIREGDIYNAMYAYRWAGLDPQNGDPRGYVGKDISKDYLGIINDDFANQVYIGSAFPLYFGNVMNTFTYAGISLSVNVSFRAGYYFRRPAIEYQGLFSGIQYHSDYSLRWQNTGDEAWTNVPSMTYPADANRDHFYEFSEVNFEKGDHIRLQDFRISYDWANRIFKRNPIRNIQLYAYAGNIDFMIWKASKYSYDPDYSTSVFPPSRSYAIGLNISLY